jgi:anti-sigma-K factor RskA
MNVEQQLKVQAYVDGELPAAEAEEVARRIAADAPTRQLAEALGRTRELLRNSELPVTVPESREFYWSKIEREIGRLEESATRPAARPARHWWWRWLAPAFGLAAVVALVMVKSGGPAFEMALTEVHMASPDMGAVTFSDQESGVTMIWLYERGEVPFTDPAPADTLPPQ